MRYLVTVAVLTLVVSVLLAGPTSVSADEKDHGRLIEMLFQQAGQQEIFKLAVVGFNDKELELQLTTQIVNHPRRTSNIGVLSRTILNAALEELKFQYTDLFDEAKRQRMGKFLGANAILTGDALATLKDGLRELYLLRIENAELLTPA
jgi:hypothetical protein